MILKLLRAFVVLALAGSLIGCEYFSLSTHFDDGWYKSDSNLHDGAFRYTVFTIKSGRHLNVRCFGHSGADKRQLDLRYTIYVPLLERLKDSFKKEDEFTLAVSSETSTAHLVKVSANFTDGGMNLLGDITPEIAENLASAKEKIFVVPRLNGEKMDVVIEFGTRKSSELIRDVIEVCRDNKTQS